MALSDYVLLGCPSANEAVVYEYKRGVKPYR
jgi:hypothetical protein